MLILESPFYSEILIYKHWKTRLLSANTITMSLLRNDSLSENVKLAQW